MKRIIPVLLASVILISCSSSKDSASSNSENKLTLKEKNEGWQLLFNGKNTDGWHNYGHQNVGNEWKVQDGAIHLDASAKNKEGGDLVTNEEYSNFDLKMGWKISDKGNSGIVFYVHDDPAKYKDTYETGIEMQILDNGTPTV